jgi:ribose/xylose/arabinose/galactoside ABC-type transport system permease subunit
MTFVILTGGIDLSVGSLLALSGIILSKLFNGVGVPIVLSIVLTVLIAGVIGAGVNGVLIGRVGLSFFVVTLGTLSVYGGLVSIWSKTQTTYISSSVLDGIGFGKGLGVPTPIWFMIGTFLIAFAVLRWTYFGRDVYAVGGNIEAARLSGINASRTIICVYGIAGLSAGLAGVIQAGRLGAASPLVGGDIPLNAAAAVLLGGTSFIGGIGGVTGTAVGVLFIGTLQNGLSISGVQSFWQEVVTGAILIAAVAFDKLQQNRPGRLRSLSLGRRDTATAPAPSVPEGE